MKTIMIDMDDVITTDNFLEIISKFLNQTITEKDIKGYYIQDILGDRKKEFFDYFKTINLYDNAYLLDDCFDVMKELNNKYDIYICTTYIWKEMLDTCGNVLKHKYDFLYKELPFLDPNKYVFVSNKKIINCSIKIDDKISNLENADVKLLFTAYHNKNLSEEYLKSLGIIRVNSWIDIKNILLESE